MLELNYLDHQEAILEEEMEKPKIVMLLVVNTKVTEVYLLM